MLAELAKATELKEKEDEREQKRQKELEEKKAQEKNLLQILEKRGIKMGHTTFNTAAYQTESQTVADSVFYDPLEDELSFSVLFIYEEYKQTDFIQRFNEHDTFFDHLLAMFPSLVYPSHDPSVPAPAPAPWDEKKDYLVENLVVYFETNTTKPLNKKFDKGSKEKKKMKVDLNWTLGKVLRHPKYVVPGVAVFYVLPKRFEKTFLELDLDAQSSLS